MPLKRVGGHAEDDGMLSSINVIPFVDIVLVLLVIFMLTSATIMRASLKVELPRAASAGSKVDSTINLVYTKAGVLELNGDEVTRDEAIRRIRAAAAADPKTRAVLSASRGADYGVVIDMIDMVKLNGINAFALDVERKVPGQDSP